MSINPQLIAVPWQLRWPIYQRLTDLGVPCEYAPYQPLTAEANSPLAALQVWSVVRQVSAPRHTLIGWLEQCWNYNWINSFQDPSALEY
ncbi:Asr1405/Asl0597 family protein [uncultured Thermosynechococcus sp.]|uniref:Asr1405/Asl0597 family protein n=2 Tax=uncultured Thermosynechococcus sp. TaxID=436945 RepID=UPI0026286BD7|nr:Asr1405/Asl0597 family protein [uncultured Thermosynechococcus sp.]